MVIFLQLNFKMKGADKMYEIYLVKTISRSASNFLCRKKDKLCNLTNEGDVEILMKKVFEPHI